MGWLASIGVARLALSRLYVRAIWPSSARPPPRCSRSRPRVNRPATKAQDAPTTRCNDGPADAKPHSRPVRLRRKKRIEDLVRLLRGKPYTGIAHGHQNFFFLRSLRLDGQLARPIHFLHRINAVHDEVHQDLLQLHTISHDPGKICG